LETATRSAFINATGEVKPDLRPRIGRCRDPSDHAPTGRLGIFWLSA
jgi:hypothetical protein